MISSDHRSSQDALKTEKYSTAVDLFVGMFDVPPPYGDKHGRIPKWPSAGGGTSNLIDRRTPP
jgi:hypothetical protein